MTPRLSRQVLRRLDGWPDVDYDQCMTIATKVQKGIKPPKRVQNAVSHMVNTKGVRAVAKELGISRESVMRLASGAGVRRGTLSLVEVMLGLGS